MNNFKATLCLLFLSVSLSAQTNSLDVDGTIKSNTLSGSGNRNVMASSDGTLVTSDQLVNYYSLTGASFHPTEIDSSIVAVSNYSSGAYFKVATPFGQMVAPVHLPHGSTVTKITILFEDNDEENNVNFMFGKSDNTSLNHFPVFNFPSANTIGQDFGSENSGMISLPIDNQSYSYHFRMQGGTLNSNFVIHRVIFEYIN